MQLTEHFSLAELIASDTAARLRLDNTPPAAAIAALTALATHILEPVRTHFGRPVTANSGYRAPKVNAAIGSKPTSQHVRGEAVDFEVPGVTNFAVATWVRDNLDFDQLILEAYRPGIVGSGWVHASWKPRLRRRDVLTMTIGTHGASYARGLPRA